MERVVPLRMKALMILLAAVLFVLFAWLLYRIFYVKRRSRKKAEEKLKIFRDLIDKLTSNARIDDREILSLAENPSTRQPLFGILVAFDKKELFPNAFYNLEKSAESFLVNWLEFPTELDAPPDNIEFFTAITMEEDQRTIEYLVFKYRKAPPPKGLSNNWMWGVVGPFHAESKPYEIPLRVFSRFNEAGTVSAVEEVRWVHAHISRR